MFIKRTLSGLLRSGSSWFVFPLGVKRHSDASSYDISSETPVIKSRREAHSGIVEMSQPLFFLCLFGSISWADFYVEDNCHRIFFFSQSPLPPQKVIFWEIELLYFTGLRIHPCSSSVLAPYYPWYAWCLLSIPPTPANTSAHQRADTNTHIIPTRVHMFVNTAPRFIKRFPVVSSFRFAVLLEVTFLIPRICNAASLHLGVCWAGRVDCIIYDEANRRQVIGTKQTRERPLVAEQSNQTQPLCI